jgi:hypothetical protein
MSKYQEIQCIYERYRQIYLIESLDQILPSLQFKQVTKKPLKYQYFEGKQNEMPPMSYMVTKEQQPVVTITKDGK